MLCLTDPQFPIYLWDQLIPQCQITLNMLRRARTNPKLSEYQALEGTFDFNATPLAPPGTRTLIFNSPSKRASWETHGENAWYVGPALEHYRCMRFFVPSHNSFRISGTAKFYPTHCKMPSISPSQMVHITAENLIEAIKNPNPSFPIKTTKHHIEALEKLSAIFQEIASGKNNSKGANNPINTSSNPTAKKTLEKQPRRHTLTTRNNKPVDNATVPHNQVRINTIPKTSTPSPPPREKTITAHIIPDSSSPPPKGNIHVQQNRVIPSVALNLFTSQALQYNNPHFMPTILTKDATDDTKLQYAGAGVVNPDTGKTINKYEDIIKCPKLKDIWQKAMCKELGNLSLSYESTAGTNCIKWMSHNDIKNIPTNRIVTYTRIVRDERPQKADPNKVRITVGGNLIGYPHELTTRTADLLTAKLLWNSVISTPGARYACIDIRSMYLVTPMARQEYMKMKVELVPEEFLELYNLHDKIYNGYLYMKIQRRMYGLPQAGKIANKMLKDHLAKYGYYEVPHTPGLFKHFCRPIQFTLIVDDFGIKYTRREDIDHLITSLQNHYDIDIDWEGKYYAGVYLDWNYEKGYVDVTIPDYVKKQLQKYNHPTPTKPQDSPFPVPPTRFGKDAQKPLPVDTSPKLDKKDKKFNQQVTGSFLFYGRAVDTTILMSLSTIASQQSDPTELTTKHTKHFLDYMATHPNAKIRYCKSDMILNIHSDASYLTEPGARSRIAEHFFLSSLPDPRKPILLNGSILNPCTILKHIAASAAEAELGALFSNARIGKIIRFTLEEMGHKQPPTPIHTDNKTAAGIANSTVKRQRSRAMDMR